MTPLPPPTHHSQRHFVRQPPPDSSYDDAAAAGDQQHHGRFEDSAPDSNLQNLREVVRATNEDLQLAMRLGKPNDLDREFVFRTPVSADQHQERDTSIRCFRNGKGDLEVHENLGDGVVLRLDRTPAPRQGPSRHLTDDLCDHHPERASPVHPRRESAIDETFAGVCEHHMITKNDLWSMSKKELMRMIVLYQAEDDKQREEIKRLRNAAEHIHRQSPVEAHQHADAGEDSDSYSLAHHFERSGAPTPEDPRHPQTNPDRRDIWRQLETEMAIVNLQGRMDKSEADFEQLTRQYESLADETHQQHHVLHDLSDAVYQLCDDVYDEEDDEDDDEFHCTCGDHVESREEQARERTDQVAHMRGGNGEGEAAADQDIQHDTERINRFDRSHIKHSQHTSLPTPIPSSPHLLCQRAIAHVEGATIGHLIIYLPPGFIVPLLGFGAAPLILQGAATIYHFPNGAAPDVVQREAWKQKACGEGHWTDVRVCEIPSDRLEVELKSAIASMWERWGLTWEMLTRGAWTGIGEGDTYLVKDYDLGLTHRAVNGGVPRMRGGCGYDCESTILQPTQRPSSAPQGLSDGFDLVYDHLARDAAESCFCTLSSDCTHEWKELAISLQARNRFLEGELEDFKAMYYDLVQDVHWQLGTQVELEEQLEAAEEEKAATVQQLKDLEVRWTRLVEHVAANPEVVFNRKKDMKSHLEANIESPCPRSLRGGEQINQPTPLPGDESSHTLPRAICSTSSLSGISATSFDFFPAHSTIIFSCKPPKIYQFPHVTTLPQIRTILESPGAKEDMKGEPYCLRILEIMEIREQMGIQLPQVLRDDRVTIAIPFLLPSTRVNCDVGIAAWQAYDADVDGLENGMEKLSVNQNSITAWNISWPGKTSSFEHEDYHQDISDLIDELHNVVIEDDDVDSPEFCTCDVRPTHGRETHFDGHDMHQKPVVSFRGGGSHGNYVAKPTSDADSEGNRQFPLLSPRLPETTCARRNMPELNTALGNDESVSSASEPLGMRLARLMFPPQFVRLREDDIRHFNWRRTQYLSPQSRDWVRRGQNYAKSPACEDWVAQLDKHRECCLYCHTAFIEEDYGIKVEDVRHEDEAPILTAAPGRPWEKGTWSKNNNMSPFSVVEDPNPRLRGGAGDEKNLEAENEDWHSEWDDLASQTQCSNCRSRTFRNSSTLSMKTAVETPSPVDRAFSTRRRPQTSDFPGLDRDAKDANEKGKNSHEKDVHSTTDAELSQTGEFSQVSPQHRLSDLDYLSGSKITSTPSLGAHYSKDDGATAEPIGHAGHEPQSMRTRPTAYATRPEIDRLTDLRAELWLESPRPAPTLPTKRMLYVHHEEDEESDFVKDIKVWEDEHPKRFNPIFPTRSSSRQPSFKTDQHAFLPLQAHTKTAGRDYSTRGPITHSKSNPPKIMTAEMRQELIRSSSRWSNEDTPNQQPKHPFTNLCARCKTLLTLLLAYFRKLKNSLLATSNKPSISPQQTRQPPKYTSANLPLKNIHPHISQPQITSLNKSLPPTPLPSTSTSTIPISIPTIQQHPKAPAHADIEIHLTLIQRAQARAQLKNELHETMIMENGMLTIAGPSDLVREAVMWLEWEEEVERKNRGVEGE